MLAIDDKQPMLAIVDFQPMLAIDETNRCWQSMKHNR
jgi:hypothetical protein